MCVLAGAGRWNESDTIEEGGGEGCLIVIYIIYKIIYNLQIFTICTTTAATSQWGGGVAHIQPVVITSEMIATYTSTSMVSSTDEFY